MITYTVSTQATFSPATRSTRVGATGIASEQLFGQDGLRNEANESGGTTYEETDSAGNRYVSQTYTATASATDADFEFPEGEGNASGSDGVEQTVRYTYSSNGASTVANSETSTVNVFILGVGGDQTVTPNDYVSEFPAPTEAATINTGITAVTVPAIVKVATSTTGAETLWEASTNATGTVFFSYSEPVEVPTWTFAETTKQSQIIATAATTQFANALTTRATVLHPGPNEIVWVATTTFEGTCAISDIAESHTAPVTVPPSFTTYHRDVVEDVTAVDSDLGNNTIVALLQSVTTEETAITTSSTQTTATVVSVGDVIPWQTTTQQVGITETASATWSASFETLVPGSATAKQWTQTTATTFSSQNGSVTFHKTRLVSGTASWTAPYGLSLSTQFDETTPIVLGGDTIGQAAGTTSSFYNETASNTSSIGFFTSSAAVALRTERAFFNAAANFSTTTGFNFDNDETVRVTLAKLAQTAWAAMPTTYTTASGTNTSQVAIGADLTIKDSGGETSYELKVADEALRTHESRPALKGAHSPDGYTFMADTGLYFRCGTTTSRSPVSEQFSQADTATETGGTFYSALPCVVGMGNLRYWTTSYNVFAPLT